MNEPILTVEDINVFLKELHIVKNASIFLNEGEIISIIGRNGAGKTTLLRTIMGLHQPKSGKIIFKGEDITHLPPHKIHKKGICMIPEGRGIFRSLTVYENLKLSLSDKKGVKEEDLLERIYNYFPVLKEKLEVTAGRLSGGEQQMLSLARGFICKPTLILLDELSQGLMPKLVSNLVKSLYEMSREEKLSIILADQNIKVIKELSARCYIMDKGVLHEGGPTEKVINDRKLLEKYLVMI